MMPFEVNLISCCLSGIEMECRTENSRDGTQRPSAVCLAKIRRKTKDRCFLVLLLAACMSGLCGAAMAAAGTWRY